MTNPVSVSVIVPSDAASAFREAAGRAGMGLSAFATECILDRLEAASRYRTMLGRIESVDRAIAEIAELIGEMSAADAAQIDLANICRAACTATHK